LEPILAGNPHTLAMPTAEPTAERMNPHLLENNAFFLCCISLFSPILMIDICQLHHIIEMAICQINILVIGLNKQFGKL